MRHFASLSLVFLLSACPSEKGSPAPAGGHDGGAKSVAPSAPVAATSVGYYRSPAIRGDVVVFAAEGDLWQVARTGGTASRLTTHNAREGSPALSPDGSTVAFAASYEGPMEVYTMPREGGPPLRRTFDGAALPVGFAPDGALLYVTTRYSTLPNTQLFRLDLATGERSAIPLAQAADGSYTPDGKTLFFTRLPFQGSHTKRYQGGTAQTIWKYVAGAPEAVPLTSDHPGTSKTPMWWNGRVYFLSDRDGTMNVWSMNEDGHDQKKLTKHDGWEADQASLGDGRIVYKLGADLRVLDLASGVDAALDIRVPSDFDQERETWVKTPIDYLTSLSLSPKGDRIALTARGQVFVAPAKAAQGRLVEVDRKDGVRYRRATFMPNGKDLVALSDESSEVELWKLPANGVGAAEQLTKDATILRWEAVPSPDGAFIAHHDKDHQLFVYDVAKKKNKLVATVRAGDVEGLTWSPDGLWLAYAAPAKNGFSQIFLYRVDDGATTLTLTSDRYDSFDVAFSPDGDFLYFLSDRNLKTTVRSPWGPRQPDPYLANPTEIYALALTREARFPFAPADELHSDDAKKKDEKKETKPDDKSKAHDLVTKPHILDRDGLALRLHKVPVPAGRYGALATDGERLYWTSSDPTADPPKRKLSAIEIRRDKQEVKTVMEDVRGFQLSLDRKKLLVRRERDRKSELFVIDASDKAPEKLDEAKVDLGRWKIRFDPREQWRQMFVEAWRLERDHFYDRGMHGLDWPKIRDKYLPLVERVRTRDDLNDVIAQMVSELSALHTFVFGGAVRTGSDDVEVASLGAEVAKDGPNGGFRVTRIYASDPEEPQFLSPLVRDGAGVQVGDVIEAVNGTEVGPLTDLGTLLRDQGGRQVLLHTKRKPAATRDVIVVPMGPRTAADLRYRDWEYTRRRRVEEEGKGAIGYVHLRAMGTDNYAEWARDYYPVFQRQGLIVDVRHNNGGNIDSWILGKLLRKPWAYWQDRVADPTWNMQYAFRGHVVVLVDEWTASDGEAFAEGARRLGLAKILGTRTWGGEIWLSFDNVLVDNGIASAAESGLFAPEGKWLIEGHGVDPDVVVDNLPRATYDGKDAQLDLAIRTLEEWIKKEPVPDLPPPPFPRK